MEAIEQYLEQLKEEDIRLEAEHRELLAGQNRSSQSVEEKTVKQQRARLEARMAILEDHNRQLEAQLEWLRQLVHSGKEGGVVQGVGLQAMYVVAAEIHNQEIIPEPGLDRPLPPGKERRQPPTGLAVPKREDLGSEMSSGSYRDSETSGEGEQRNNESILEMLPELHLSNVEVYFSVQLELFDCNKCYFPLLIVLLFEVYKEGLGQREVIEEGINMVKELVLSES